MSKIKNLIYITLFLSMCTVNSQDLSSSRWNHRIILLLANDISDETYQKQISELQNHQPGLKERKLIVYHVLPKKLKKGLSSIEWKKGLDLFETYKKTNSGFEFVLIGLDGGIKLQQSEFVTSKELFSIIDVMPMRRNEIRKED